MFHQFAPKPSYRQLFPPELEEVVPVDAVLIDGAPEPEGFSGYPHHDFIRMRRNRQSLYETGLVTVYYRVDAGHRLVIGGRGPMRPSEDPSNMAAVALHAQMLRPEIARVGWRYAWNGRIGLTTDLLPHLHAPQPGLLIAYGYNGRDVALAIALGARLAAALTPEGDPSGLPLPISDMRRIPLHRLWRIGVQAAVFFRAGSQPAQALDVMTVVRGAARPA